MISELILTAVFGIVDRFLSLLPEFTWNVDTGWWGYARSVLDVVAYLLPIDTVVSVIAITVGLMIFRIVIAFIKTVWDLLPFV